MCLEMDPRARTHPAISKTGCQSACGGWGARALSRPSREALRLLGPSPKWRSPGFGAGAAELSSPVGLGWSSAGPKQPRQQPHSGSCGVQQGPERRVAWNTPPSPPHTHLGTGSPGVPRTGLSLSVLSQESHETQHQAEVPVPEGHLRNHPEDPAPMPGLPPPQVPGERDEEGE